MIAYMKGRLGRGGRRLRVLAWRSRWVQAGGLVALWWLCERASAALGAPVPGGVLGLGILLVLLGSGRFSQGWVRRGASGLLEHLMLFFVPAMLALVDRPELFGVTGLKLLGVVAMGTVLVMAGTAGVVEWSMRRRMRCEGGGGA